MASICSAVLAGIQKFAPRNRLLIPFVVNWSPVCAAMPSAVRPLSSSLCTCGRSCAELTRRGREGGRGPGGVGGMVGHLGQGAVEVCLVEGEREGGFRDEQEDLKVSQVVFGVGEAAVLVRHPELFGGRAEAVGLGAAPTRRRRRHDRRDDFAVDGVRELAVALGDVLEEAARTTSRRTGHLATVPSRLRPAGQGGGCPRR
jgi:hypothetical protein